MSKVKQGDFVIAINDDNINIAKNSVGLVKDNLINKFSVYFVGVAKILNVNKNDIEKIELEKTGKGDFQ